MSAAPQAAATLAAVQDALRDSDVDAKLARVAALPDGLDAVAGLGALPAPAADPAMPGRPARPPLVPPREVATRGLGTVTGRAALIHAVAHIEFNAVNLALDAVWRFRGLPDAYYADWLSVARDEARHFGLLRTRLRALGVDYGSFSAHNGLWEAAEKTAADVLARMCCVPRVLEARGLDVTPGIIRRLREVGDGETCAVLEVILAEEVRHVRIGTDWFLWLCRQRGLDPLPVSAALLAEQGMQIRPPLNLPARRQAGFSEVELAALQARLPA